ncbi:MmoB/DmpM family protein [Azoarcus sp. DN11]|uniref:MmoB/DmpM family protein n=1 Tax=Azoarcus sp. DN11 TaxID=356837 RepID=UPI002570F06B|nr:MmoB/DmpM family protein [Azoarcus sp. DN11]
MTRQIPEKCPVDQKPSSGERQGLSEETSMILGSSAQAYHNNMVGPIMRAGDLATAVIEAAKLDNPGRELFVEDKRAYIRIHMEQEMVLRRQTIEEELGRPFKMNDLEVDLSSFAGQIESRDNEIRFYFVKKI